MAKYKEKSTQKSPSLWWIVLFLLFFLLALMIQMPLSWLAIKLMPNQQKLSQFSGNLWQGEAMVTHQTPRGMLQGRLNWKVTPIDFLWAGVGANVEWKTDTSHVKGHLFTRGQKKVSLTDFTGELGQQDLNVLTPLKFTEQPIKLNEVSLTVKQPKQLDDLSGEISWAGGDVTVPMNGTQQQFSLPKVKALLSMEDNTSIILVSDGKDAKLSEIRLQQDGILEAKVTQRLMLFVKGYQGQAGLDTFVVTSRQPLWTVQTQSKETP